MTRALAAFDLIHSDMWGLSPITTFSGYRYYVTFIDDYTRCTWVYLLHRKSEVFSTFVRFLQMIKTQFRTIVRNIRSDTGGEYISNEFCSYLNQTGILQQLPCPRTFEQKSVIERKNRHIMSIVRDLLRDMGVPKSYWHMVVLTTVYVINRTLSFVLYDRTLFHILIPTTTLLPLLPHVFGCTCFVQNRSLTRVKLNDKSIRCIFFGYSSISKGPVCFQR